MNIPLNIILHANQEKVHSNPARFRYVKSCKKFGKSWLGLYTIAKWAGIKHRGLFWYLAPTYGQVFDIAWLDLIYGQHGNKPIIPIECIRRKPENDMFIEIANGSKIQFKGTENLDRLRGPSLDGCILDEAAFMNPYVRVIIESQIAVTKGPLLVLSTPNPEGPGWFSTECDNALQKQIAGDKDYAFWKFTIHDNPLIDEKEKQRLRDSHSDDVWNLEYMAEESSHSGILVSEFNYALHVKEDRVDGNWMLVRGLDWGIDHPTGCLWVYIQRDPQKIHVADEFMRSDLRIEESCGVIKAMTGNRKVDWSVIDPSTRKRNSQTLLSDVDEFNRAGVPCILGDNNYRGYDVMKLMFKKNIISIHPKCRNLILQLRTVLYSGKFSKAKGADDLLDPLRYVCLRVHDIIFGGNLNANQEEKEEVRPGKFSFKDGRIFMPRRNPKDMAWAYGGSDDDYEEVA